MRRAISLFCLSVLLALPFGGKAQELNCSVQIQSQQIQGSERIVFDALQRSLFEFVNNRRWTNDKFAPAERIECSMVLTISERVSTDQFRGDLQISSNRPIYGTTYSSTLFRFQDKDINFKYLQFDVLNYSDNAYIAELTSVIAFYVYIILAHDYDSYSPMGGTPYWNKALQVVNNSASSGIEQWQAFGNRQNRYWYIQYNLDPRYEGVRKATFTYHRKGFDQLADNVVAGRKGVMDAINQVKKAHENEPNSFVQRLFFVAKHEEIIKLFSGAEPDEKKMAIQVLQLIDPANISKYDRIQRGAR